MRDGRSREIRIRRPRRMRMKGQVSERERGRKGRLTEVIMLGKSDALAVGGWVEGQGVSR